MDAADATEDTDYDKSFIE
jgi:methionine aminopeptidase